MTRRSARSALILATGRRAPARSGQQGRFLRPPGQKPPRLRVAPGTMRAMPTDRPTSSRDHLCLPMTLADGSAAMTRNVSAHGLFFTLPSGHAIDDWLLVE